MLVIDPIATRLTPLLARITWLMPNVVTLVAFAIGMAGVGLFAAGMLRLGAVVFEVHFLFDCLDGSKSAAGCGGYRPNAALILTIFATPRVPEAPILLSRSP